MQTQEMVKKILVIEEEPGLRMVVQSELQRAGYHVDALTNGAEATARLSRERYDLVVMNVLLPDKSGLEILNFMKEKRVPGKVIMIAGMDGTSLAIKALKHGADDFIPKPFDAEYLLRTISTVLQDKR